MTRATNARIAGGTLLVYIAAGVASLVLFGLASAGAGIVGKLAAVAQHTTDVRVVIVLHLLQCFAALVLAAAGGRLTRGAVFPHCRVVLVRTARSVRVKSIAFRNGLMGIRNRGRKRRKREPGRDDKIGRDVGARRLGSGVALLSRADACRWHPARVRLQVMGRSA
jgi:hypothetical protein